MPREGTADDKAGIATHLAAFRAHGGEPPVGVTVFVEGEEESGSPSLSRLLAAHVVRWNDDPWVRGGYEPGDMVVFDGAIVHCGLVNRSKDRLRLSMEIRFQGPAAPRPLRLARITAWVIRSSSSMRLNAPGCSTFGRWRAPWNSS